jgi:hypothetical protein
MDGCLRCLHILILLSCVLKAGGHFVSHATPKAIQASSHAYITPATLLACLDFLFYMHVVWCFNLFEQLAMLLVTATQRQTAGN